MSDFAMALTVNLVISTNITSCQTKLNTYEV